MHYLHLMPKMDTDKHQSNNLLFLKENRKLLRNESTPAEIALWQLLKGKKVKGYKFRRQHSVGHYILDFYCPKARIAIELDGEIHHNSEAEEYDENRTRYLEDIEHIKVLRFENQEVFNNPEGVQAEIENYL